MNLSNGRGFFSAAARRSQLYRQPVARNLLARRQHFLGQVTPAPAPSTGLFAQFTDILKQALPAYQQVKILREQEKRRAAGLPPLETEQLAPTVRVQAGLDPQLVKMLMFGGLAVGGALLFMGLTKRR
jgi:hypothetical protein